MAFSLDYWLVSEWEPDAVMTKMPLLPRPTLARRQSIQEAEAQSPALDRVTSEMPPSIHYRSGQRTTGATSNERGNGILRTCDRWLGIPLVFTLGLFRAKRKCPAEVNSIGLFMLGAIGDSIMASAVIEDLKRRFPQAVIVAFFSESNRDVLQILDGVDESVLVPLSRPHRALSAVRHRPVDLLLDFSPWPRVGAVLSCLARTRFTIGLRKANQFRHFAYDAVGEHRSDRHEIENVRSVVRCLDIKPVGRPRLKPGLLEASPTMGLERPYVLFHPWAAGYRHFMREWPTDRWIDLAQTLIGEGYSIAISGAPSDRGKALALAEAIAHPSAMVLAGTISLAQLVTVLAKATAVVSVNSGIMHLAAAIDCPLVALHGPTNPLRWGPLGRRSLVVGPGADQGGAYLDLGFEYPADAPDIMSTISVAEVLTHLANFLPIAAPPDLEPVP